MPKVSDKTKAKALDALEGMRQIVRREMVAAGRYINEDISNPNLTDAARLSHEAMFT